MRITKSHEDNAGQTFDFDTGTGLFRGTVENTSTGLICDSRTEIHLGTDMGVAELGPGQWLGGVPYADELGARLELDRRLTSRLWGRSAAAYREHAHRAREFLDGPVVDFTAALAWTPAPVLRVQWTVGYENHHAALEAWRTLSRWLRVGHLAGPAAGLHAGHQRPDAAHALRRQRRAAPSRCFVHEARMTNAQAQDYERNRAELRFVRQF